MTGSWSVCPACGCVVANTSTHAAWHETLAGRVTVAPDTATGSAWAGPPVPVLPDLTQDERDEQAIDRAAIAALVATAGAAHTDGQPWVRPVGAHDAFRLGATVTHGGKTWASLIPFNVTMPGDPADPQAYRWWKDITPAPEPEPGPQPWNGNGVRYIVGAEVTYLGATYRVRQEHTSQPDWTPDIIPALYLPI